MLTSWNVANHWTSTPAVASGTSVSALFDDSDDPTLPTGATGVNLNGSYTGGTLFFGNNNKDANSALTQSFAISTTTAKTLTLAGLSNGGMLIGLVRGAATSGTQTINANLVLSADQAWAINSAVDAGGTALGSLIVNGIVGSAALTKLGGGVLELKADNSGAGGYSGAFTLQGGTVQLDTAGSLGSSTTPVQINASGTSNTNLLLSSNVTFAGGIAVAGLTSNNTTIGSASSTATVTFSGGIALSHNLRINAPGTATVNITNAISDSSGTNTLTNIGSGQTVLSGTNTYGGVTAITAGTLALSTAGTNNIALSKKINVGASAKLDVRSVAGGFTLAATRRWPARARSSAARSSPAAAPSRPAAAWARGIQSASFRPAILPSLAAVLVPSSCSIQPSPRALVLTN